MIYSIVNPSDDLTFEAPDLEIAALSMFLLSNGQYGADCQSPSDRGQDVPIFLAGGALTWWSERFDHSVEEAVGARAGEVAAALDSLVYGSPADRDAFIAAQAALSTPESRRRHAQEWADGHRSSDNDIAGSAAEIAANLRCRYLENSRSTQQ